MINRILSASFRFNTQGYFNVKTVLQICQNYHQPFLDCTRQYTALFKGTDYRVVTVFICGDKSEQIAAEAEADEVLFLEHHRDELDGLKLGIIKELREIAHRYDFQACIAHRNKATYLALFATKLPVISVHHAFGDFSRLGRKLLSWYFKDRLTLLAVSNAVRDEIRQDLRFLSQQQILTLYNRVNVEALNQQQLSRTKARAILGLEDDSYVIANVGRLHPDKDQTTLIKGFALALEGLPANSTLVIVGQGKDEQKLLRLVHELGIEQRVVLTGHIKDAKRLFKAFDLFVLSSDHEPFGMVLLEALAAGVPVICSNCGGGPEVIAGVGTLFEFGNADSLSKALLDTHSQQSISVFNTQARNQLDNFSDETVRKTFWAQPRINQVLDSE